MNHSSECSFSFFIIYKSELCDIASDVAWNDRIAHKRNVSANSLNLIGLLRPLQLREEVSSLSLAASRPSLPSSAGLFLPATPALS